VEHCGAPFLPLNSAPAIWNQNCPGGIGNTEAATLTVTKRELQVRTADPLARVITGNAE
jgi:hypothetical protein